MNILDLRCEYRHNPIGIDVEKPRLSWKLDSSRRGAKQTAFQVAAALDDVYILQGKPLLWDTGKIDSDQSIQFPYEGPELQSRQRVYCFQSLEVLIGVKRFYFYAFGSHPVECFG